MNYTSPKIEKKGRKWLKVSAVIISIIALLGVVGWRGFEMWYGSNLEPVASSGENVTFVVSSGETPDEIAKNLEDAGLIKHARAFTIYLDRSSQRSKLQAGTYRLNPSMSTSEIVGIIASGKVDVRLLTIVPGQRLDQLKEDFLEFGYSADEIEAAFNADYSNPLISKKPQKASLEGYIFPESFFVTPDTSLKESINRSFDEFWKQVDDNILAGIKKQGLNFHEAVTLASIVGRESADEQDQKKIAQVFLRRLNEGIPLGADPTFFYAAAIAGVEPTTDIDSPYNTRIVSGLPPGPIANFNFSAFEAVANPAGTNYLYFVSGDDGITRFSNTEEEHNALRDEFCIELCQL